MSKTDDRTTELHDSLVMRKPKGARMRLAQFVEADPSVYVTIITLHQRPRMTASALVFTHLWNYAQGIVEVRHDGVYWLGALYIRKVLAFDEYHCEVCGVKDTAPRYEDMQRRGWVFRDFDKERWEETGQYGKAFCPNHKAVVDAPHKPENGP